MVKNLFLASDEIPSGAFFRYVHELNDLHAHSLIVRHHDRQIAELYWKPYNSREKQIMFSVSKSFTAVAVLFAVQDGLCSLETPICDILEAYVDFEPEDRVRRVKIRHLLTMTFGFVEEGVQKFYLEHDWLSEALSLCPQHEPGSVFFYDNRCPFLCSVIVTKLTGKSMLGYLQEKLFTPLGIDPSETAWERNLQGYDKGAYGLSLTSRGLARFGQFILNGGRWQGVQLLKRSYVDMIMTVQTPTRRDVGFPREKDNSLGYSYFFWKCQPAGAFRASGLFGQFSIVLPEQDMVIAITSGAQNADKQAILSATWRLLKFMGRRSADDVAISHIQPFLDGLSIKIPPDDESFDPRMFGRIFRFPPNKLKIRSIKLLPVDENHLTMYLSTDKKDLVFSIKDHIWQKTVTDKFCNDKFDSCSTIFYQNPYIAYGWQKKELMIKLVYNQGVFIDTIVLRIVGGRLQLHYMPMPGFMIRSLEMILLSV